MWANREMATEFIVILRGGPRRPLTKNWRGVSHTWKWAFYWPLVGSGMSSLPYGGQLQLSSFIWKKNMCTFKEFLKWQVSIWLFQTFLVLVICNATLSFALDSHRFPLKLLSHHSAIPCMSICANISPSLKMFFFFPPMIPLSFFFFFFDSIGTPDKHTNQQIKGSMLGSTYEWEHVMFVFLDLGYSTPWWFYKERKNCRDE